MMTKPGHPSVPKTAGSLQDEKRWRSLWASVDGALVERMGLSMVRQLGLQSGVAMEVTGRCAETFRLRSDGRGGGSEASTQRQHRPMATSLATQTLIPGTTGRGQMKSVPHLSSHDGPGRDQTKGCGPTRNRKVVGSNPTSGSICPGEGPSSKTSECRVIRRWQPEHLNCRRYTCGLSPRGAAAWQSRLGRLFIGLGWT
jgi:hypothetical protein